MKQALLLFLMLGLFVAGKAQHSLCLEKGDTPNSIRFQAEEINKFLQLQQYKIIFFGEQHNGTFDPEIKYHLITDLNKLSGIRHIFAEMGFARAWHINKYLQTGELTYLTPSENTQALSPYSLLWKRLMEYNRTLPDSLKLIVHGIDFERTDVFQTLQLLASKDRIMPASLQRVLDTIQAHAADSPLVMYAINNGKLIQYDNSSFVTTLRYVQARLLENIEDTKIYYAENFSVVNDIINNKGIVEVRPKRRNESMFEAMRRIVKQQKIEKFIGFFGGEHITYTRSNSLSNAASGLKEFGGQDILTIMEAAYNIKLADGSMLAMKNAEVLKSINNNCRATLLPATKVPGYSRKADFVIIADVGE